MLLAVDIGNTNLTLGLFKAGALVATRRAATTPRATADELDLLLDGLLRLDDAAFADIGSIACASVVPQLTAGMEAIAARRDRPLIVATVLQRYRLVYADVAVGCTVGSQSHNLAAYADHCVRPAFPLRVRITTTPFAAAVPYSAAAEGPLIMSTDSISSGFSAPIRLMRCVETFPGMGELS